ncbi:hypothetical protein [Pseudomonas serboccidentalis]|uniref:hypothetical protein n=1 Tax=Pseudomonas serboccidentalis TaxID=2964670 RepID=UPI0039E01CD2
MFTQHSNQNRGRRLFFWLWILMLVIVVVRVFTADWMSAFFIFLVSSIFFIPAFVLSEAAFARLVNTLAKISFLAPLVRFLGG